MQHMSVCCSSKGADMELWKRVSLRARESKPGEKVCRGGGKKLIGGEQGRLSSGWTKPTPGSISTLARGERLV